MYRILVVDDDYGLVEMLDTILTSEGYEVARGYNGMDAVACLSRGWRPDMLLIDLQMPIMDGIAVCHWLATHSTHDDRPSVAVLSASLTPEVGALSVVDALIAKPYNLDVILGIVSRFCVGTPRHQHAPIVLAATA